MTGTDKDGASSSQTVTVTVAPAPVVWPWEGFFAPIDNVPVVNTVKAGQAIPVKFSLGGDRGLDIFQPGYPASRQHSCTGGAPTDAIEQTDTAGGSTLTYDPATERYHYVWKTQKSWTGQCRTFVVRLHDGSEHTAEFQFR